MLSPPSYRVKPAGEHVPSFVPASMCRQFVPSQNSNLFDVVSYSIVPPVEHPEPVEPPFPLPLSVLFHDEPS